MNLRRYACIVCLFSLGLAPVADGAQSLPLWNGSPQALKCHGIHAAGAIRAENGAIAVTGQSGQSTYHYLVARVGLSQPVSLASRQVRLEVQVDAPQERDSIYAKFISASGKVVASFYTLNVTGKVQRLTMTPGRSRGGVKWIARDVCEPEETAVARVDIYLGRKAQDCDMAFRVTALELEERQPDPPVKARDLGVGISSAELRFCVAALDRDGHHIAVAAPEDSGDGYLLLTDLDTGKTSQHYITPRRRGSIFGGGMTADGHLVFGYSGRAYIFDINTREYREAGKVGSANLCACVSPDQGTVYLGSYPNATLASVTPEDGAFRDFGKADDQEQYLSYIAIDSQGYVYCGIGTARANVVVFDPRTGTRTQLMPESQRTTGTALVLEGEDGCVYASCGAFRVKCLGGKIVQEGVGCPRAKPNRSLKYGTMKLDFSDGARIVNYDLDNRKVTWQDKGGVRATFPVEYVSGGLDLTCMASGPDGQVYYSAAHPQHLGRLSPGTLETTDLGHNPTIGGGNFCNMTAVNGKIYGCEYGGGRLWEYNPDLPAKYSKGLVENFGLAIPALLAVSTADGGRWTELTRQGLLLGIGELADNRFTLAPDVPHAGQWYCHLQFYKSKGYGTVTLELPGETHEYNLQSVEPCSGEHLVFGPFQREAGPFPIRFSIAANAGGKFRLFSLIGLELTEARPALPLADAPPSLNPRQLGSWPDLVGRPRAIAVHPHTGELVISGFAGYGLTGGGFGIHDLATGQNREIREWLEGESCICMAFLPDGTLVGGSSILAPGGGHLKAERPSVFRLDWKSGKVSGSIPVPNAHEVIAIAHWHGRVYAATSLQHLLVIEPMAWETLQDLDISENGGVPRNGLLKSPDGERLFMLQNQMISEITDDGIVPVTATDHRITAGGAVVDGKIFYCHSVCRLGYAEY
ncbi:MAG: PQQ-like beta-propeller repeat protein [Victivallales bacterium]|nr:PQQ-like beta-propeller repeat protein [Victivallales bacterium]